MTSYLLKRILRSLLSVFIVVGIVMVMIYSMLDRKLIFAQDPSWTRMKSNAKVVYEMQQWEGFGYVDYVPYTDYLMELLDRHYAGKQDNSRKIWTVYMFLVWYGVYFAD